MFSWQVEASHLSQGTPGQIWALWSHVESWPLWDEAVEWSKVEGSFVEGAVGSLKPKGWPITHYRVTSLEQNRRFSTLAKLPFTTLEFIHEMEQNEKGKIVITHRARIKGLLAPLLRFTMAPSLKRELPKAVAKLSAMAERR